MCMYIVHMSLFLGFKFSHTVCVIKIDLYECDLIELNSLKISYLFRLGELFAIAFRWNTLYALL